MSVTWNSIVTPLWSVLGSVIISQAMVLSNRLVLYSIQSNRLVMNGLNLHHVYSFSSSWNRHYTSNTSHWHIQLLMFSTAHAWCIFLEMISNSSLETILKSPTTAGWASFDISPIVWKNNCLSLSTDGPYTLRIFTSMQSIERLIAHIRSSLWATLQSFPDIFVLKRVTRPLPWDVPGEKRNDHSIVFSKSHDLYQLHELHVCKWCHIYLS